MAVPKLYRHHCLYFGKMWKEKVAIVRQRKTSRHLSYKLKHLIIEIFFSGVFGQLNYFFDIETIQSKIKTANISAYFLKTFNFMKTIHVTSPIINFSCFLGWEERNSWNGLVWSFERALKPGDGQVRCWQRLVLLTRVSQRIM